MADYSIWVLEYAHAAKYPYSGVVYGAHNQGTIRLPYCYALFKGHGHLVMVDVGYNHKDYGEVLANRFGVTDWHSPKDVLGQIGFTPEDVDTVVLTHTHFDHMGNLDDFPRAKMYIQEEELSKQIWAMSLPDRLRFPSIGTDPADLLKCVGLAQQGRLTMLEGDMEEFLPGVDIRVAYDTHTPASQYVVIRNDGQKKTKDGWVLAGDLVYGYENITGPGAAVGVDTMYLPVGLASGSNTKCVLAIESMMKEVDHDQRRLIPIHERRLVDDFPSKVRKDGLRVTEICLADGEKSRL